MTDVVAACDAALSLARFEALAGLLLLVWGEDRLAAELDAVRLGVGPPARGALHDAATLQLRGNAEDREDDLGKVRGRIEVGFYQRTDTGPGATSDFPKAMFCDFCCKRNIEMTPLCKIEVTLPRVPGSRGLRRGDVVDEQAGVQPS